MPWIRLAILLGVAGVAWLFRDPLLGLVRGRVGTRVVVARVERTSSSAPASGDVVANGYIVAERIASLSTPITGRLVHLGADVGDVVTENDVVARVFSEDLEALEREADAAHDAAAAAVERAAAAHETARREADEARAAESSLRAAGARLLALIAGDEAEVVRRVEVADRARREVDRQRPLYEAGRLDGSAFDALLTTLREADAAVVAARHLVASRRADHAVWEHDVLSRAALVATAEARVAEAAAARNVAERDLERARRAVTTAAVQVAKSEIRAPFGGLVIRKDAEVGEVLASMGAGNTRGSVLTIVDPESFVVQVELSERRILSVKEDAHVSIHLDAEPDKAWPGHVDKTWPRADRSKGTIEVRVAFDERPPYARPDMAARVVFHADKARPASEQAYLGVPADAVVRRGEETTVWVVVDGRVGRRAVRLGTVRGDRIEVLDGLVAGDVVVRRPVADLRDGQDVTVGGSGS